MSGDLDLLIGKWTVWVKNWTWEYEFQRDGRVTWRDLHSAEKSSGNWAATSKLVNMWWKDSATRESWQRPLTASSDHTWYESSYYRGKYRIEKANAPVPVPPGPAPGPSPGPAPSSKSVPIEQTVGVLARMFTYRSPWRIVGSAGGSGGFSVISAGGGSIDVVSDGGDKGTIKFVAAGASLGFKAMPFSLTFSTRDMTSVPGLEQTRIRARTSKPLEFDDLTGPMAVASFTATSIIAGAEGGSLSIYFFGLPGLVALGSLIVPGAAGLLGSAALNCKAMGMTAGEVRGADASVSVAVGYGW